MKNTDESKKCSSDHWKEWKKGKKAAKYGKKRNIPLKEFKGVKHTKQYKAEVEKLLANATKEKGEVDEKTSSIASILRSEIQKQVKFTAGTKPSNPTVASSDIEIES